MFMKIIIVKVNSKYCDFLRKYESKVSYNAGEKELRPFVGILFNIGNCEYFAPFVKSKIFLFCEMELINLFFFFA